MTITNKCITRQRQNTPNMSLFDEQIHSNHTEASWVIETVALK